MKRRSYLTAMLAAIAGTKGIRAQQSATNPIVLYGDLTVDPSREEEMLKNFHNTFKPAAEKFPGYIDVSSSNCGRSIPGTGGRELSLSTHL